nr:MAG TPA_asm: hypothetical protein [Bacteriophage sp.]
MYLRLCSYPAHNSRISTYHPLMEGISVTLHILLRNIL